MRHGDMVGIDSMAVVFDDRAQPYLMIRARRGMTYNDTLYVPLQTWQQIEHERQRRDDEAASEEERHHMYADDEGYLARRLEGYDEEMARREPDNSGS